MPDVHRDVYLAANRRLDPMTLPNGIHSTVRFSFKVHDGRRSALLGMDGDTISGIVCKSHRMPNMPAGANLTTTTPPAPAASAAGSSTDPPAAPAAPVPAPVPAADPAVILILKMGMKRGWPCLDEMKAHCNCCRNCLKKFDGDTIDSWPG